jgi:hypothetical protein
MNTHAFERYEERLARWGRDLLGINIVLLIAGLAIFLAPLSEPLRTHYGVVSLLAQLRWPRRCSLPASRSVVSRTCGPGRAAASGAWCSYCSLGWLPRLCLASASEALSSLSSLLQRQSSAASGYSWRLALEGLKQHDAQPLAQPDACPAGVLRRPPARAG